MKAKPTLRLLPALSLMLLLAGSAAAQTMPIPQAPNPDKWGEGSNTNVFFRGDMAIAQEQMAQFVNRPMGGFSFGMYRKAPKGRIFYGGSLGMLSLQSQTWTAPYSDPQISVADAQYNRSTTLGELNGFVRVELFKDMAPIVPYAEGGLGVGLLGSYNEVTMENPKDNCDVWVLSRQRLSQEIVPNVYAGGGALVRLTKLGGPESDYSRVYLDFSAISRTSFGEAEYYYGRNNWEQRNSPLQMLQFRAGILFRFNCPYCKW